MGEVAKVDTQSNNEPERRQRRRSESDMTKLIMIAAAGVLLAAPLQAQSHDHRAQTPAAGEKQHECPMHGAGVDHMADPAHRYMPKMLMQHTEMLKLSAEQTAALEKLQAAHKAECEEHMVGVKAAEAAAAKLLDEATVDLQKYEASLREAAELKVKCRVGMVATGQQAKALLTPEQLEHLTHMTHAGH